MEIIQERLEREFDIEVVQTAPTVTYEVKMTDGAVKRIDAPSELPDLTHVEEIREPFIKMNLILPGRLRRRDHEALRGSPRAPTRRPSTSAPRRVILDYEIPLAEIIYDFYDKLKSAPRGYGTMDYELIGFRATTWSSWTSWSTATASMPCRVIVHRDKAEARGRKLLVRLKQEIARHLFEIPLQAAIGGKIIARETIKTVGKNVTAKCYGGDVTPQAQAAGEAEGRQEAHEAGRHRRHPAGGLHGRAGIRRLADWHLGFADNSQGFPPSITRLNGRRRWR